MSDIAVGIKLSADGKGLVNQLTRTRTAVNKFEKSLSTTSSQAKRTSRNLTNVDVTTGKLGKRMLSTISPMGLMKRGLAGIVASIGIAKVIQYSDEMTNLNNQLKLVTGSQGELIKTQSALLSLANGSRSSLTATVELYTKLYRSTRDLEVSNRQLMAVTDAINQSFVISGASIQEAEGSTRQLAQALDSGAFRGDEFNSVAEQSPRLMQALAKETGKTVGELRGLAAEGKITSEVLIRALVNQSSSIKAEFDKLGPTIAQAGTVVNNNLKSLVGTFNDTTGASSGAALGILAIGNVLGDLNAILSSGAIQASFNAVLENWRFNTGGLETGISYITNAFEAYFDFVVNGYKQMGKAIALFPQNIRYLATRSVEEFKYLVSIGSAYGKYFANAVAAQLTELKGRIGVLAREIADTLQFWDGDNYNYTAAMAQASSIAEGLTSVYQKAANDEVQIANDAREIAIGGITKERDAAVEAFDVRIAKAKALATANIAAASNPNLAPVVDIKTGKEIDAPSTSISDSEIQTLRDSLLTKEQTMAAHYERNQMMINAALVQKKITEDEHNALSFSAHKKHMEEKSAYTAARNNLILSSSQQIFGALAGLAETFGGKQSKAYRVMFAVQKGFAIAQGVLNLSQAISNAFALPFPANIPAMATAAATGTSLLSNIKGANYQGQAHDGVNRMPAANEGTYMVRRDEMVLNPRQRENFDAMRKSFASGNQSSNGKVVNFTSSPTINVTANGSASAADVRQQVELGIAQYDAELQADLASNGPRGQLIGGRAA